MHTPTPQVIRLKDVPKTHATDVWATGQDVVAVIKRQLQLLLPGVQVFLGRRQVEFEPRQPNRQNACEAG